MDEFERIELMRALGKLDKIDELVNALEEAQETLSELLGLLDERKLVLNTNLEETVQLVVFFRITEMPIGHEIQVVRGYLAPNKHVIEVIAIVNRLNDGSKQEDYPQLIHAADAILHLKSDNTVDVVKNRFADFTSPNEDAVSAGMIVKAYYHFINSTKEKWG